MVIPALMGLGVTDRPIGSFSTSSTAFATLVSINFWRWFPFNALMILAGLTRIPADLHKAVRVEDAGPWRRFTRITWPPLAPTLTVLLVIGTRPRRPRGGTGGPPLTILSRIDLPQIAQGVRAVAGFAFVTSWTDHAFASVMILTESRRTVPLFSAPIGRWSVAGLDERTVRGGTGVAEVRLDGIAKSLRSTEVIPPMHLTVAAGTFCVLVGPSGRGKSTLRRMIAALEAPSAGRVRIGWRKVTGAKPSRRGVVMVVRSDALYRHGTVAETMDSRLGPLTAEVVANMGSARYLCAGTARPAAVVAEIRRGRRLAVGNTLDVAVPPGASFLFGLEGARP